MLNVDAPVTPIPPAVTKSAALCVATPPNVDVDTNIALPLAVNPPVTPNPPPVIFTLDARVATPAIPTAELNVAAPVTPSPPAAIFTLLAKLEANATFKLPPINALPVTPIPPAIATAADVLEVAFNELPNVYCPASVVVYDGKEEVLAAKIPPVTLEVTS